MAQRKTTPVPTDLDAYPHTPQQRLQQFLDTLRRRGRADTTIRKRQSCLLRFLHYLYTAHIPRLQDVRTTDLDRLRKHLLDHAYSQHTIYATLVSIRLFYTWLADTGHLFENPAADRPDSTRSRNAPGPRIPPTKSIRSSVRMSSIPSTGPSTRSDRSW